MEQFDVKVIHITGSEDKWDKKERKFLIIPETDLRLKHSLYSIRMWESKWKIPFLHLGDNFTEEQLFDYIRCMTLNKNLDPVVYRGLKTEDIVEIITYINDPHTATWFSEQANKQSSSKNEIVTCERIYSWMRHLNIPFECERWHFQQLMTLIRVSMDDETPEKKEKIDKDFYARRKERNRKKREKWEREHRKAENSK